MPTKRQVLEGFARSELLSLKMVALAVLLLACRGAGADWSKVALDDAIESSVMTVKFEIKLPKGWKRDVNEEDLKAWRPDVEDFASAPSVAIGYVHQPPTNLDAYIESLTFVGTPIVDKKEMTTDFLVVARHSADNGLVRMDYMRHRGASYVGCSAFQMKTGGVPKPQETMDWLESICKTLTIK